MSHGLTVDQEAGQCQRAPGERGMSDRVLKSSRARCRLCSEKIRKTRSMRYACRLRGGDFWHINSWSHSSVHVHQMIYVRKWDLGSWESFRGGSNARTFFFFRLLFLRTLTEKNIETQVLAEVKERITITYQKDRSKWSWFFKVTKIETSQSCKDRDCEVASVSGGGSGLMLSQENDTKYKEEF